MYKVQRDNPEWIQATTKQVKESILKISYKDHWRRTQNILEILMRDNFQPERQYTTFPQVRYALLSLVKEGKMERKVTWKGCYGHAIYRPVVEENSHV